MRVRNKTGVPQGFNGFHLIPGRWYEAPEQIPFNIVTKAWQSDAIEWDFGKDDPDDKIHLWMGLYSRGSGYGTANENLTLAMLRNGASLDIQNCFPTHDAPSSLTFAKDMGYHRVGCCFAVPDLFNRLITPVTVGFTMCESTDPLAKRPEWRQGCDQVDRLIVPSQFCKDVFGKFYKRQIDVVGLPLHDDWFAPRLREEKDTFTIAMYGVLSARKSPLETIELFQRTFPKRQYPDVRLEIKTRLGLMGNQSPTLDDYRIKLIDENWTRQQLIDWLYKADCMLFLTKGEGYGMPPREALCLGTPVIATDTSGLKDLSKYVYSVAALRQEQALIGGKWDIPDWDKASDWLLYIYNNRPEAYANAFANAEQYIADYSPAKMAKQVTDILDDASPTARRKRGMREQPKIPTLLRHKPFYDLIEGKVVWDIGIGDGVGFAAMVKKGKTVYGLVNPGEKAAKVKLLRKFGIEPNITECRLIDVGNARLPDPDIIISQSYFQSISPREVNMILASCYRECKNVVFSVPTVYYPGHFSEGANLMRRPAWEDYLSNVAVQCRYYGKNDRYMSGKLLGLSKPRRNSGRRTGDTWRPTDKAGR